MSKIHLAFDNKKAFIAFLTAGDPSLEKTEEYIKKMEKAGADIIEIGIPFSDPIAEGTVIQEANVRALLNEKDCTLDKIFAMVERLRKKVSIPLVFLTYLNPIFRYGYEEFCKQCAKSGVDGFIVPDMPYEESRELREMGEKYGVDIITLIAPTSEERIQMLAKNAKGYIYLVSSMGVTGMRQEITTDVEKLVEQIRKVSNTPIAVGFGIHSPEQVEKIARFSDGVIVGSAIVNLIAEYGVDAGVPLCDYISAMRKELL